MKYRSGLLAALLSIAIAAPVFAQDDTAAAPADAAAAPAADAAAPADTAAAPAEAAPVEAAPADAAAAEPAPVEAAPADAAATDAAPTDAAAAPADAAPVEAAPADATAAAPEEAAPAEAAPAEAAASEAPADTSASSSSEGSAGGSAIKGHPFYVSPMFSYTLKDGDAGVKDGLGGVISIGKRLTDGLNLELNAFYTTMKGSSKAKAGGFNGDAKLKGFGLTALVFPLSSLPNAFGIVSVDYGTGSSAPYGQPLFAPNPSTVASLDYRTTVFDLGVGYLFPITERILLRAEARYRMDSHGREYLGIHDGEKSAFYEGVFNIGVLIPLGGKAAPAPAAAEAPVAVVAAEAATDGDDDGDGVLNSKDKCPGTPAGTKVNEDGCALDTDGDGVSDDIDECPNTPAGAKVLANGCALTGDCRTPKAGEAVDENGCAVNKAFILKGVNFEFDSDRLTAEAKEILNGVAETLKSYADLKIEVAGHTDDVGTEAYNLGLSERRANSVKTYLASRGTDVSRLTPVGYGKTKPVVPGTSDEDRAKNRRVELNVKE